MYRLRQPQSPPDRYFVALRKTAETTRKTTMPGYANWKTLYHDEFRQLFEEGFLVGDKPTPDITSEFLPFPEQVRSVLSPDQVSEAEWEQAYWNLWKVREKGIRPDFPYREPDTYAEIIAQADPVPQLEPLSEVEYTERIRGAWFGRCAGVVLGKPLEMGWNHHQIRDYLESVDSYPLNDWVIERSEKLNITLRTDCVPSTRGHVRYTQPDDDIHYTVMSLLLAEQKGLEFTVLDVGKNLLDNVPYRWLWGADNQIYYHLVRLSDDYNAELTARLDDLPLQLNPWREWIDGQLKADFWGYITPCDPRRGAIYIHRQASLSLIKNGIYGGMFVSGCLSAALSTNPTVDTILAGGLSVIPKQSRLAVAVKNVMGWYAETPDWIAVCDKIYQHYGHLHFADQINNLALVTLALVHGRLDYTASITTAVMAGTDVDCNAATVGSIVGAALGYDALDTRWVAPLNDTVKTVVAGFGEGSISELVRRTIAVHMEKITPYSTIREAERP
jgi:hypothetical protein